MPAHFRRLDGANTIETGPFRHGNLAFDLALEEGAMAALFGDAGTGKTHTIETARERYPDIPQHVFDLPGRPTPKQIAFTMLKTITGIAYNEPLYRLDERLIDTLSRRRSILIFDEAQRYNLDGFEYVRHLSDQIERRIELGRGEPSAFFFVGGHGCASTLMRYPMLESRISYWVEFTPLSDEDVLTHMRDFHPLYAGASNEDLLLINQQCTYGSFRAWTDFTRAASTLCTRSGRALDTTIIENAFGLMKRPNA